MVRVRITSMALLSVLKLPLLGKVELTWSLLTVMEPSDEDQPLASASRWATVLALDTLPSAIS